MVDEAATRREDGRAPRQGFQELEIVAFVDRFKVVGMAYFGVGHRASSRRASDFIRSFNDTRLTLAEATIYDSHTGELLEKSPFVVLNLDKVDLLYARDDEATRRRSPARRAGRPARRAPSGGAPPECRDPGARDDDRCTRSTSSSLPPASPSASRGSRGGAARAPLAGGVSPPTGAFATSGPSSA